MREEGDGTAGGQESASNAAERVIARFGGIRPTASKLGVAVSTVQGWKMRGHIPVARRQQIEKAAEELGVELEAGELVAATSGAAEEPLPTSRDRRAVSEEAAATPGTSLETDQMRQTPWREVGNSEPGTASTDPLAASPQPTSADRRGGQLLPMIGGGLLVAGGAAVAILLSDFWMPESEPPPAVAVEALERRMARLEEQRVEGAGEAMQELQRGLEQTRARLEEVDGRVAVIADEARGDPAELEALQGATEGLSSRLDALEGVEGAARLSSLEAVIEDLAVRLEEVAAAPAAPDDATRGRLESLEGRLEGAAGRIEALEARLRDAVAEVEAARVRVGEETAIALAAGQLREAFRTGQPYAAELEGLQRLSGRDENLDAVLARLETHADQGVPTLASLQASYPEAASAAIAASRSEEADEEWQALFWNRVNDLVTVRPVGEPEGSGSAQVLARAERRLEEGDLAAALAELDKLEGPAAAAMAEWRARADRRQEATDSLAALSRVALERLGGAGG
ncbi:MAG TPA: mitofilin family membrane protein [Kiloniellales bacterium]|nr:mitofilin family membrane protein [Kiloniellales bacterium]